VEKHDRLPRSTKRVHEDSHLGQWVRWQRSAHSAGKLSPQKAAALLEVPGWREAVSGLQLWMVTHSNSAKPDQFQLMSHARFITAVIKALGSAHCGCHLTWKVRPFCCGCRECSAPVRTNDKRMSSRRLSLDESVITTRPVTCFAGIAATARSLRA
jgi:hypothetical protein